MLPKKPETPWVLQLQAQLAGRSHGARRSSGPMDTSKSWVHAARGSPGPMGHVEVLGPWTRRSSATMLPCVYIPYIGSISASPMAWPLVRGIDMPVSPQLGPRALQRPRRRISKRKSVRMSLRTCTHVYACLCTCSCTLTLQPQTQLVAVMKIEIETMMNPCP